MSYWKTTAEEDAFNRYRSQFSEEELARMLVERDQRLMAITAAAALVTESAGCGDNSCLFVKPSGMATNGGCRCFERGSGRPGLAPALGNLYRAAVALRGGKP